MKILSKISLLVVALFSVIRVDLLLASELYGGEDPVAFAKKLREQQKSVRSEEFGSSEARKKRTAFQEGVRRRVGERNLQDPFAESGGAFSMNSGTSTTSSSRTSSIDTNSFATNTSNVSLENPTVDNKEAFAKEQEPDDELPPNDNNNAFYTDRQQQADNKSTYYENQRSAEQASDRSMNNDADSNQQEDDWDNISMDDDTQSSEQQATAAQQAEEQLGNQFDDPEVEARITKNINERVAFKTWRKKWGVDTAEEIRARIDKYADSYADAITFKNQVDPKTGRTITAKERKAKFKQNFKEVLSEGLMANADKLSYYSEWMTGLSGLSGITALAKSGATRMIRSDQVKSRKDISVQDKLKLNNFENLSPEEQEALNKKYNLQEVHRLGWRSLKADRGRLDFRSNEQRINDMIDIMKKPPLTELNDRLNLTKEEQQEFFAHAVKETDWLGIPQLARDAREAVKRYGLNQAVAVLTTAVLIQTIILIVNISTHRKTRF